MQARLQNHRCMLKLCWYHMSYLYRCGFAIQSTYQCILYSSGGKQDEIREVLYRSGCVKTVVLLMWKHVQDYAVRSEGCELYLFFCIKLYLSLHIVQPQPLTNTFQGVSLYSALRHLWVKERRLWVPLLFTRRSVILTQLSILCPSMHRNSKSDE